jgi:hypothetical protein
MAGNQYLAAGLTSGLDGLTNTLFGFHDRQRQNEQLTAQQARQNLIDEATRYRYQRDMRRLDQEEERARKAQEDAAAAEEKFQRFVNGVRSFEKENGRAPTNDDIFYLGNDSRVLDNPRYSAFVAQRAKDASLRQARELGERRIEVSQGQLERGIKSDENTLELAKEKLKEATRQFDAREKRLKEAERNANFIKVNYFGKSNRLRTLTEEERKNVKEYLDVLDDEIARLGAEQKKYLDYGVDLRLNSLNQTATSLRKQLAYSSQPKQQQAVQPRQSPSRPLTTNAPDVDLTEWEDQPPR